MNNFSLFTADRMTHLKIVVVSLLCATLVAGVGVAARINDSATTSGQMEATVVKAGKPLTAAVTQGSAIR
jgi:ABC-type proline/glycine betaine transport system permease subunit